MVGCYTWIVVVVCLSTVTGIKEDGSRTPRQLSWSHRLSALRRRYELRSERPLVLSTPFLSNSETRELRNIAATHAIRLKANGRTAKWCFSGRYVDVASDILGRTRWGRRVLDLEGGGGQGAICAADKHDRERFESSELRRRTGTSLTLIEHEETAIDRVERLLETTFGLPKEYGAPGQFLIYPPGADYGPHVDCFLGHDGAQHLGDKDVNDRIVSIIVYLSTGGGDGGGNTIFPELNLTISPKEGDILLWTSLGSDGTCLSNTTHYSSEQVRGTKYAFQKWYHRVPTDHDGSSTQFSNVLETYRSVRDMHPHAAELFAGSLISRTLYDRTVFCEGEIGSCREFSVALMPELVPSVVGEL